MVTPNNATTTIQFENIAKKTGIYQWALHRRVERAVLGGQGERVDQKGKGDPDCRAGSPPPGAAQWDTPRNRRFKSRSTTLVASHGAWMPCWACGTTSPPTTRAFAPVPKVSGGQ